MGKFKLPIKFNLPLPGFSKAETLALGLDIGSFSVKICEMGQTSDGYRLLKLGSAQLPSGAVEDGVLQDPDAVGAVISRLLNNLKIKQKKVAISMSGYSVIVKKINVAVMEDKQLEEHIQSEAEQYIPFDIDEVYLDYHDLNTNTDESDFTDVMLVAAKKDVVNAYLDMLAKIGLQVVVVDVDAFALENSFEIEADQQQNVVLIDIGAAKMSINIISHGASILARDVVMGGHQITEQMQRRLELEYDEAEAMKVGSLPTKDGQHIIEDIFVNNCSEWVLEIKKAIDFYVSNYPDDKINRLVLSGGGAKINGFAQLLAQETGVPAEIFDPFTAMDKNDNIDADYLSVIAPEMAISTGLAVRLAIF
jgi:type IV pilus assembly protein PilM